MVSVDLLLPPKIFIVRCKRLLDMDQIKKMVNTCSV